MASQEEIVIEIPQGKLKGVKDFSIFGTEYYSFQGIPYAKPPIGDLRFKAPVPAEKWEGIRNATQSANKICPAYSLQSGTYDPKCDEGALVLNVFTRQKPGSSKKLPVMVNVHGGGFVAGSGMTSMYGPDIYMNHDVVLVSFNYRLNVFGFLSLQTPECPGNYGLKDQRLLLRWVQQNISYFGGDPDNVTIFGCSAGGASVEYLLLSPSTKGLFHKAIAQSGSALNRWAYTRNPRKEAFLLGKTLGCDTTDDKVLLEFLRKASPEDVTLGMQKVFAEIEGIKPGEETLGLSFVPTAEPESEDSFLTEHPSELWRKGCYHDVPFISGATQREMMCLGHLSKYIENWKTDEEFQDLIPRELKLQKGSQLSLDIAKRIREFYFSEGTTVDAIIDILSDTFFLHGIHRCVTHLISDEQRKSPTYLYVYAYPSEVCKSFFSKLFGMKTFPSDDTMHGEDIFFQFVGDDFRSEIEKSLESGDHYDFMKAFTNLWVSFAKNGNPTLDGKWEPMKHGKTSHLVIGNEMKMEEGFFSERMQFWDEIYKLAKKESKTD